MCYTYILTNHKGKTLYIGSTSDIHRRISEHRRGIYENSFTQRYRINRLIYYECFNTLDEARIREAQIKECSRTKKVRLIEKVNPLWQELLVDNILTPLY